MVDKLITKIIKYHIPYLTVILFIYCTCHAVNAQDEGHKLNKVVIDAGHGGKDSGARGSKSMEKDIVLSISLKVGQYIEKYLPEVEVIYTRTEDVFVPLHERAEIANKNNADLFISVHANANPSSRPYGTETYAMGLHKSDENLRVAQLENSAILYEENYDSTYGGFEPNSAESYIIFSLMQNTFLDQSLNFASYVQHQFRERVNRKDRGVKQAGFLVLWKTTMPSVLVETGFISNPREEKFLMSEQGQDYLASAIFRAFRDYKEWYDEKNKLPEPAEKPKMTSNEIEFKVQVFSSHKQIPLNADHFNGLENVEEIKTSGLYKYAVGEADNYEEIIEVKESVREEFPGAFIIALRNGKIISLDEALSQKK